MSLVFEVGPGPKAAWSQAKAYWTPWGRSWPLPCQFADYRETLTETHGILVFENNARPVLTYAFKKAVTSRARRVGMQKVHFWHTSFQVLKTIRLAVSICGIFGCVIVSNIFCHKMSIVIDLNLTRHFFSSQLCEGKIVTCMCKMAHT